MGYFVSITDSNFRVPASKLDAAYKALVKLNERDDLKSGGASTTPEGVSWSDARPEGMDYHPAKWFAWMHPNYPSECPDIESILSMVGYELEQAEDGALMITGYSSKTGCEDVFAAALAPFVEPGSYLTWEGEEGEEYRWAFDGKRLIPQAPVSKKIEWEEIDEDFLAPREPAL